MPSCHLGARDIVPLSDFLTLSYFVLALPSSIDVNCRK